MRDDKTTAQNILEACNPALGWVYSCYPVTRYVELDTTQGCEYFTSDVLNDAEITLLRELETDFDTLTQEELHNHAAANIVNRLTTASVTGLYSIRVADADENNPEFWFGHWTMSGYMDMSSNYGPHNTATELANDMANFWDNE